MGKNNLSKKEIIKKRTEFNKLFASGNFVKGKYIDLLYREGDVRLVGFAVSRKIKKAVQRNRCKRLLRELYRTQKHNIPEKKEIILYAKPNIQKAEFKFLQKEFCELLAKLN